jgi:hypothetical protein
MRSKLSSRLAVLVATLLLLWGASLGSAAHALLSSGSSGQQGGQQSGGKTGAPTVTILGLRVNGTAAACGASVNTGDEVCVRFSTDQNANARVIAQKDEDTPVTVASGSVVTGVKYITCVTAGTADSIIRKFTVQVTNGNGTNAAQCSFTVVP